MICKFIHSVMLHKGKKSNVQKNMRNCIITRLKLHRSYKWFFNNRNLPKCDVKLSNIFSFNMIQNFMLVNITDCVLPSSSVFPPSCCEFRFLRFDRGFRFRRFRRSASFRCTTPRSGTWERRTWWLGRCWRFPQDESSLRTIRTKQRRPFVR